MRIANMNKRILAITLIMKLLVLLCMMSMPVNVVQAQQPTGTPVPTISGVGTITPVPGSTPTPGPGGIQQIIHRLFFPAETISDALTGILSRAAEREVESLTEQTGDWALMLGEVVQAQSQGYYQAIAQSGLPVAAALAPALFLLRLAIYHWRRLVGDDDSALRVIGDWVLAGVLAVIAGPFLDLIASLGWWIAGATLGETSQLAMAFIQSTTVFSIVGALARVSLFSGILIIGVAVGGILAMAGMLFAFASANAALYVMAVIAAPLAVAGVIPQMRWMRSLWIKAVALLALLPVLAGGIFKASVTLGAFFAGDGLLSILIRLLWLWGATGFLLAIAGILARMTLSTSADALGQLVQGVKAIVSTAVLAGAGAAGGGVLSGGGGGVAAGPSGGAGGTAGGGTGGGGVAGAAVGGTPSASSALRGRHDESILGHYDHAQTLTQRSGMFSALGLRTPAQYTRTQARLHELAARKLDVQRRMARFSSVTSETGEVEEDGSRGFGFSPSVDERLLASFSGTSRDFQEGFSRFAPHIEGAGLDPGAVAQTYPEDTGRMVGAYLEAPQAVEGAENPLMEAARRGGADTFLDDVFGESVE
jgi:hypothetical protein